MAEIAVEIKSLSVIYENSVAAVDRMDLEIPEGEFFALLGPNGAGKTSVISSITGLIPVEHGEIKIFGHPVGTVRAKRLLGIVPQETVHHGFFEVEEVLHFYSGYYGIWKNSKRIDFLLERLHLSEHRHKRVSQLSGGMKRRLSIAKALLHSPKLLLLDEPSAGVDIELRAILWEFMKDINEREGVTILLTTHYLEEAERLCSRLAIMNLGKLLAVDSTSKILSEKAEKLLRLRLKDAHFKRSGLPASIVAISEKGPWLEVVYSGSFSVGEILGYLEIPIESIVDIQVKEGALEDAFMRVLKGAKA